MMIKHLTDYVNANQGGVFILNENDKTNPHLELISCYAYERKKYQNKIVEIGEGLVGQAYLEKETIYITDIPKDYIQITSGLGGAAPVCILIVPIKNNNSVEGVLEIASFNVFQEHEVAFIEKLAENIASALSNLKTNEKTKTLLHESQVQGEQLRSQEEEMRQNMEELSATQEQMISKEKEYIRIIDDLKLSLEKHKKSA
jgi:GAF domain-containing protein